MLTLKMQGLLWALVLIITFISIEKNTYKALYKTPARQIGVLACALVFAMLWQIKAHTNTYFSQHKCHLFFCIIGI